MAAPRPPFLPEKSLRLVNIPQFITAHSPDRASQERSDDLSDLDNRHPERLVRTAQRVRAFISEVSELPDKHRRLEEGGEVLPVSGYHLRYGATRTVPS